MSFILTATKRTTIRLNYNTPVSFAKPIDLGRCRPRKKMKQQVLTNI